MSTTMLIPCDISHITTNLFDALNDLNLSLVKCYSNSAAVSNNGILPPIEISYVNVWYVCVLEISQSVFIIFSHNCLGNSTPINCLILNDNNNIDLSSWFTFFSSLYNINVNNRALLIFENNNLNINYQILNLSNFFIVDKTDNSLEPVNFSELKEKLCNLNIKTINHESLNLIDSVVRPYTYFDFSNLFKIWGENSILKQVHIEKFKFFDEDLCRIKILKFNSIKTLCLLCDDFTSHDNILFHICNFCNFNNGLKNGSSKINKNVKIYYDFQRKVYLYN